MQPEHPIIVFSHLPWNFVFQRPQHVMTRLARSRRVLYIEEPSRAEGAPYWDVSAPQHNLTVCKPYTPVEAGGFAEAQAPVLTQMVSSLIAREGLGEYAAWLYTPLAMNVVEALEPVAIVYDCMDELSAFNGASPHLLRREGQLLGRADLVFTGGPSLYRSKRDKHPDVYCFPSSVDVAHFRAEFAGHDPPDQARLPHPRLGFYGVIDERMDLAIVDALAAAHPEWQVVMVGPIAKIELGALPQRPNIHYLGAKTYEELPEYLAGWDVCLLPFARNRSTRFISPTKTLEYMAAELPIVSTPITDVAEPYGDIVYLGPTPEEFVRACERALVADAGAHAARASRMREVLAHTSWDRTAADMQRLLDRAIHNNLAGRRRDSARKQRIGEPGMVSWEGAASLE